MFRVLNQIASYIFDWKTVLLRSFLIGLFIAFFLIVFQPFGTAHVQMPNKSLFLAGYGIIVFLTFSLLYIGMPKIFTKWFQEEQWKVWKEMVFLLVALSITFWACYCYKQLWFGFPISLSSFLYFYPLAFSLSVFPVIFLTMINYIYHLRKHQSVATTFNEQIPASSPAKTIIPSIPTTISFKDENGKEDFNIPQTQLLFIKAANNYVEITYQEEAQIKMYLLRNRLSNIEQQLSHKSIVRCHRSYLVNLDKVGRITGNAQGYKLHFPFTSEYVVPVSRTKGKDLLALLQDGDL